jgi:hypothetical protein
VVLSLPFAQRCLSTPLTDRAVLTLERRCRELVVGRAMPGRDDTTRPILRWERDSLLLQGVEVPGVNGCWLNMSEDAASLGMRAAPEDGLSYTTHNVDSMAQAFCLLSCWLHWVNGAAATLSF